jgi:hypothetical protein
MIVASPITRLSGIEVKGGRIVGRKSLIGVPTIDGKARRSRVVYGLIRSRLLTGRN